MNTQEKIKEMLIENLRIPEELLSDPDAELFGDDIGLDSVDSIEIIAGIDDIFGVDMTDSGRDNFRSVRTLAEFVDSHMSED